MEYLYSCKVKIEEYDKIKENQGLLIKEKLKIKKEPLTFVLLKKSLDARKKPNLFFNLKFLITLEKKEALYLLKKKLIEENIQDKEREIIKGKGVLSKSPVIVGSGPAGLFCAYILALEGYKPVVIERGGRIEDRVKAVDKYIEEGIFDPHTNIVFGEGGAGTFSDAKLTSRSKNPLVKKVLETFVKFGGKEDILKVNNPHLGTDGIRKIIVNMREEIIKRGGKFLFDTKFIDFREDEKGINVITDKGEVDGGLLVLAIGHSSRDTARALISKGIKALVKGFSLGFRIEHETVLINKNQYGRNDDLVQRLLGNSEYRLTYKGGRGIYSFCMCPGGFVVPSNSFKEEVVTNGMSFKDRGGSLSNSAVVATVNKEDVGEDSLKALLFQEEIERKAYLLTGKTYKALGQNALDFIGKVKSDEVKVSFAPTYKPGIVLGDFWELFPENITVSLREGLLDFDKKIPGFVEKGFLTGPETRTSSPIQFRRDELNKVLGYNSIYIIGEGAGFAGGIVSSGIDGIKTAEYIMKDYGSIGVL